MTSPWSNLDTATGTKDLYLDSAVIPAVNRAFEPYRQALQTLIDDVLENTTGYFGTDKNPLATFLTPAFNAPGTACTSYCKQQLSQTTDFVKTACEAAGVIPAADSA